MDLDHRGHRGNTEDIFPWLSGSIIGCAMKVHSVLGPGLLESAYEACLCCELGRAGLAFQRQIEVPVKYGEMNLDCGYRLDLLVEDSAIIEVKAVDRLLPIHDAQLLSYLRLSGKSLGLLINFNVTHLRNGIKRRVF